MHFPQYAPQTRTASRNFIPQGKRGNRIITGILLAITNRLIAKAHPAVRRASHEPNACALHQCLLAAVAALGLGGNPLAMPALQSIVKALGSAYLLWLAWRVARSGPPNAAGGSAQPVTFVNGMLLLWLNRKTGAMTLARLRRSR